MSLISNIKSLWFWTGFWAPLFVSIMAAAISYLITEPDQKSGKNVVSVFQASVIESIKIGHEVELGSLTLIYEAITNTPKEALEFRSGFREALLNVHLNIVSGSIKGIKNEDRLKWANSFKKVISTYDQRSPYQGLHAVEGGIFRDLASLNSEPKVEEKSITYRLKPVVC